MAYTAIDNPELYFQAKLYTGSGGTQSITLDGDEDMQPDLIWIKSRADTNPHTVVDSVRGATKIIWTNVNSVEGTYTDEVTSFDSDGFSLGASSNAYANENTETHVAWCWKESATAGFEIIAYTGTGSNMDVSHNLSAVPDFFVIKNLEVDQAWRVFHKNMTTADPYSTRMVLSETGAETTSALGLDADPTSSVINIGTGTGCTNASGEDMIVYAWSEIQGFSKFGSFVGNQDNDGPFIYTGFRPALLIWKQTTSVKNWHIKDNKRLASFNPANGHLYPNQTHAEEDYSDFDFLSNGIKIRHNGTDVNESGETYVYMAFAESPFVNSNGVPCNAR